VAEDVSHQVNLAALPAGTDELFVHRFNQAGMVIGNDEIDAAEPSPFQRNQ
jgi:hypothetical protein